MDKYLEQTLALLRMLQATLPQESFEISSEASHEMWQAIREIVDRHGLTVQEMLHATLACHAEIIEITNEQLTIQKEKNKGEE